MDWINNVSYLIWALKHFNNWLNSLSADIWISVKTLNDFMLWNASQKTIKLVERYLLQKLGAINNLMMTYHDTMKENNGPIASNVPKMPHNPTKIITWWIEVEYKWKWERWWEVEAEGIYIDDKHFIIKSWSKCTHSTRLELLPHKKNNNIRWKVSPLLRWKNPYLKQTWVRSYEFARDYISGSSSGAVSILHWYNESGFRKWIVKSTGETLGEYLWK